MATKENNDAERDYLMRSDALEKSIKFRGNYASVSDDHVLDAAMKFYRFFKAQAPYAS